MLLVNEVDIVPGDVVIVREEGYRSRGYATHRRRQCTGKCRQFNGFGVVQAGSGPEGR